MSLLSLESNQEGLILPEQERAVLTKSFFKLMEHWGLSLQEQAALLGWDYRSKRTKIDSMRRGAMVLENDRDKIERIRDLINIHKCLRILFPTNRELVYAWVKVPRERFGGHSALNIMLSEGKSGLSAIRYYLEHERTH